MKFHYNNLNDLKLFKSKEIKYWWKGFKQLPRCSTTCSFTDYGYEYDCSAKHEKDCNECLCSFYETGGLWNPDTGKKENKIIANIKYGIIRRKL